MYRRTHLPPEARAALLAALVHQYRSAERMDELLAASLWEAGQSGLLDREMAAAFSVSESTIARWRKRGAPGAAGEGDQGPDADPERPAQ